MNIIHQGLVVNFISFLPSLQHISGLLSKRFCLSVGMALETVVFHLLLVSVGVLSPVVDLMPFQKIQLSVCGTRLILSWIISAGLYMKLCHQRHNELPV